MYVFDSWALLAIFQHENEGERVFEIIKNAWDSNDEMAISAINVGEIWYSVGRNESDNKADEICRNIDLMRIEIVDASRASVFDAARIKKLGGLSHADSFAAALAFQRNATLVTGDFEFKKLEPNLHIRWLR